MSPEDLAKLGVQDQDTCADSQFARVLLLGPPKAGKTTSLLLTSPKPLLLNADLGAASKGARNLGAKFLSLDVNNSAALTKGVQTAEKLVKSGDARTVILDTITLLSENLLDEKSVTLSGFDLFREYGKLLTKSIKELFKLRAHVFLVAHFSPRGEFEQGVMPAIAGAAKVKIPALVDDWIALDYDPKRKPEEQRQFLLGAQGSWSAGGRNIRRTCVIPADVRVLLKEFGLQE